MPEDKCPECGTRLGLPRKIVRSLGQCGWCGCRVTCDQVCPALAAAKTKNERLSRENFALSHGEGRCECFWKFPTTGKLSDIRPETECSYHGAMRAAIAAAGPLIQQENPDV